ncbi:glycosyltransferase family 2 protein [Phascolarctobacterium sp.]|uniref:glycosyltransferase family 2 protein n=1 Tax=Phascolarctobacterium sp. TaxID=2049039 RepID=UPI003863345B
MEKYEFREGLVSIIMPAYNASKYIEVAIRSVLEQSFENWELLVINDCSTDNTAELVKKYEALDSRIRLVNFETNQGVASARNHGLNIAAGEYVAFLDSDDVWEKNKLEKQISFIKIQKADMVCTAYSMINGSGDIIKNRSVPKVLTYDDLLKENVVIFSSTLFLHNAIENLKFSKEWFHEDYIFLLDFLRSNHSIAGLNDVLMKYRIQNQGRSFNKINAAKNRWLIYRRYLKLGIIKSLWYFSSYTVRGIIKYKIVLWSYSTFL